VGALVGSAGGMGRKVVRNRAAGDVGWENGSAGGMGRRVVGISLQWVVNCTGGGDEGGSYGGDDGKDGGGGGTAVDGTTVAVVAV
jgi:hypothetical protein